RSIVDRFYHGATKALMRRLNGRLLDPCFLGPGGPLKNASVPQAMKVGSPVEKPDLSVVSASVVVLANIHRQVHVFYKVDEKAQGESSVFDGLGFLVHEQTKLIDPVRNATVLRIVGAVFGNVTELIEGHQSADFTAVRLCVGRSREEPTVRELA